MWRLRLFRLTLQALGACTKCQAMFGSGAPIGMRPIPTGACGQNLISIQPRLIATIPPNQGCQKGCSEVGHSCAAICIAFVTKLAVAARESQYRRLAMSGFVVPNRPTSPASFAVIDKINRGQGWQIAFFSAFPQQEPYCCAATLAVVNGPIVHIHAHKSVGQIHV